MMIPRALLCLALPLACLAKEPVRTVPWTSLKLLSRPPEPTYPLLALMGRVAGKVGVRFELDEKGEIRGVQALDGPQSLRGAAEWVLLGCKFEPFRLGGVAVPARSEVDIPFTLPEGLPPQPEAPITGYALTIRPAGPRAPQVDLDKAKIAAMTMLARLGLKPVEPEKADPARTLDLSLDLGVKEMPSGALLQDMRGRVATLADRGLPDPAPGKPPRVWSFQFCGGPAGAAAGNAYDGLFTCLEERLQPPCAPAQAGPGDGKAVDALYTQMRIKGMAPLPRYPPIAKASRIQGTVIVELFIDKEGVPALATVLAGPHELAAAAVECALEFRFEPALLNGHPQPGRFRLTLPFRLR